MKKRIPLLLACLLLTGCGVETESYDQPPQVMVDDTLYITTGHPVPGQSSADTEVEGTITSEVDSSKSPTEDDQSNFGIGYGYRTGLHEGTLEVLIDGDWVIFATGDAKKSLDFTAESYGYRPEKSSEVRPRTAGTVSTSARPAPTHQTE